VTQANITEDDRGRVALEGDLSFASVPDLWRRWRATVAGRSVLDVDLSGVRRSDSAGLALLVACLREARQSGAQVRFFNIPSQMLAIARVSGLEEILPLHHD
jgi:phospholipid transport system transporter-binding protein